MYKQSVSVQDVFTLFQTFCRHRAIAAVGPGWDANKRESEFWGHYWAAWCQLCAALNISEVWWCG